MLTHVSSVRVLPLRTAPMTAETPSTWCYEDVAILLLHRHEHEGLEPEHPGRWVDDCAISDDCAGAFEVADAAALLVLTLPGATHVVYLGIAILRSPGRIGHTADVEARLRRAGVFVRGCGVSALSPRGC